MWMPAYQPRKIGETTRNVKTQITKASRNLRWSQKRKTKCNQSSRRALLYNPHLNLVLWRRENKYLGMTKPSLEMWSIENEFRIWHRWFYDALSPIFLVQSTTKKGTRILHRRDWLKINWSFEYTSSPLSTFFNSAIGSIDSAKDLLVANVSRFLVLLVICHFQ